MVLFKGDERSIVWTPLASIHKGVCFPRYPYNFCIPELL